ncbi:Hypothetical predicted protein [Pelobates cultripes]|uniref:Uncharacterized protein n=1 Tax=Pelobates cultripes TaxID=61616 RepID=A0AAD1QWY4_PELCU|nr:Hypothetical predicted protein [Pelobates cultripes]
MTTHNVYHEFRQERRKKINALFHQQSNDVDSMLTKKFFQLENLLEKETRKWWEITSLEQYLASDLIPRGLRIIKMPAYGVEDKVLMEEWSQASDDCSKKYMQSLIDFQKRSLKNIEDEINTLEGEITKHKDTKTIEIKYKNLKDKITFVDDKVSTTKSSKFRRDQDDYKSGKIRNWSRNTTRHADWNKKQGVLSRKTVEYSHHRDFIQEPKRHPVRQFHPRDQYSSHSSPRPDREPFSSSSAFLDKGLDQRKRHPNQYPNTRNRFQVLESPRKKRLYTELEEEDNTPPQKATYKSH